MLTLFVSILLFCSCKKEYTCKCTLYFENGAKSESTDKVRTKTTLKASEECNEIGQNSADVQVMTVSSYECVVWE